MEHQKTKRREWVKTAAIIFLAILLVLTFFSNTIMNHSLPEVAAQYAYSGTINAKIRGTGTISANETYDVTLSQTRKIRSVLVRVGQEVAAGDVLFTLEAMESDELKQAQDVLEEMELSYQKSLIEASNTTSTENRDVQKLREEYNQALAIFRLYSNSDPNQIAIALKAEEAELNNLQRYAAEIQKEYTNASSDTAFSDLTQQVSALQTEVSALETELNTYYESLDEDVPSLDELEEDIEDAEDALQNAREDQSAISDQTIQYYQEFLFFTDSNPTVIDICANNLENLHHFIQQSDIDPNKKNMDYAIAVQKAYHEVTNAESAVLLCEQTLSELEALRVKAVTQEELRAQIDDCEDQLDDAREELRYYEAQIENWEHDLERLKDAVDEAQRAADQQSAVVENLRDASSAGEVLRAAEQALEDKVFSTNLGDSGSLDLQNAKKAIEEQKLLIEELSANADGQEIAANVSGVVSEIHVTAGNTAGADMPIATITVADRGYTVQIPVTNEQARQVRIGDMAEITNFWYGNLTATLENIGNDPQSMGKGKILIFRLTGDGAEAGMNLTLSIGQKSANYDTLVPNSAVRTDANGSFVLVVVAKSSPLGNRYVATRADVQVLASDDTTSAVSGLANGDFVITTSTVPIEAGSQVRLVDNG